MRCLKDVIYVPPPGSAAGSPYMEYSDVTFNKYLLVLCCIFSCLIYPRIQGRWIYLAMHMPKT
jgi:hypothetical protein